MWDLRILTLILCSTETMIGTPPPASELQQSQPQALHYALANAQQVQIHQIGEDGQVQVVRTFLLTCLGRWGRELGECWRGRQRKQHTDSLRWGESAPFREAVWQPCTWLLAAAEQPSDRNPCRTLTSPCGSSLGPVLMLRSPICVQPVWRNLFRLVSLEA